MNIHLTPDQQAFVAQAIASGRIHAEEEAVSQALALWEARERRRAEILLTVDRAETSLAAGAGRVITQESMQTLADEVKQRGRARLAAAAAPSTARQWRIASHRKPKPTSTRFGITLRPRAAA